MWERRHECTKGSSLLILCIRRTSIWSSKTSHRGLERERVTERKASAKENAPVFGTMVAEAIAAQQKATAQDQEESGSPIVLCALSTKGFFCASLFSSFSSSSFYTPFRSTFSEPATFLTGASKVLGFFLWLCIWRVLTFQYANWKDKICCFTEA